MQTRPRTVVHCPHCGAANPATASRCEACSRGLIVYIGPAQRLPRRFGLGSLMALVASIGVGLGLFRAVPLLGAMILVLIPAALVRAMAASSQRSADERPMSADEWTATFVNSIGVTLAVLVSAILAFVIVAMPAGSMAMGGGRYAMPIALSLACLAGAATGLWVLRKLWPYKG